LISTFIASGLIEQSQNKYINQLSGKIFRSYDILITVEIFCRSFYFWNSEILQLKTDGTEKSIFIIVILIAKKAKNKFSLKALFSLLLR